MCFLKYCHRCTDDIFKILWAHLPVGRQGYTDDILSSYLPQMHRWNFKKV